MATIKNEFDYIQEAREQLAETLISKFGVREQDILDADGNIKSAGLWASNSDGSKNYLKRLHDWAELITATNVHTDASLTFKDDGYGDIPNTAFNGSKEVSISYNSIGAAPAVAGGYLPLAGGTMVGQIVGNNTGGHWIEGRTKSVIYQPRNAGDWHPVIGFKTNTGSWEFGSNISNDLAVFSWGSDSNYNSGTNDVTRVFLRNTNGTIALTSEIPTVTNYYWANVHISDAIDTTTSPIFANVQALNLNLHGAFGTDFGIHFNQGSDTQYGFSLL